MSSYNTIVDGKFCLFSCLFFRHKRWVAWQTGTLQSTRRILVSHTCDEHIMTNEKGNTTVCAMCEQQQGPKPPQSQLVMPRYRRAQVHIA
jgi:hypothetical protein